MIPWWWSVVLTLGDIAGHWFVGSRLRWGWVWNGVVELLWIVYSIVTGQPGFIVMSLLHIAVFSRNWVRWGDPGHSHIHRHPHDDEIAPIPLDVHTLT